MPQDFEEFDSVWHSDFTRANCEYWWEEIQKSEWHVNLTKELGVEGSSLSTTATASDTKEV